MSISALRQPTSARAPVVDADGGVRDLDDFTRYRLWNNPCWLSGRLNYLAMHFNGPVYGWSERELGIKRPELVVIYSLGLKDGLTAQAIAASTGFPKNTISRGVTRLLERKLLLRITDAADGRNLILKLTPAGRALFEAVQPRMLMREQEMLASLTGREQRQLADLLAKMFVASPNWSVELEATGD